MDKEAINGNQVGVTKTLAEPQRVILNDEIGSFLQMKEWNNVLENESAYQLFCNGFCDKGVMKTISGNKSLLQFVNDVEELYYKDTRKLTAMTRKHVLDGICLRLFSYPTFEDCVISPEWREENAITVTYLNALNILFDRNRKEDLIRKTCPNKLSKELVNTIRKNLSQVINLEKVTLEPLWDMLRDYLPRYLEDGFFVAFLPYFISYHIAYCSVSIKSYLDLDNVLNVWKSPFRHFEIADSCRWFYTKGMEWIRNIDIPMDNVYQVVQKSLEEVFAVNEFHTMGSVLKMKGLDANSFTVFAYSRECLINQLVKGFEIDSCRRNELKDALEKDWDRIFNNWAKSGSTLNVARAKIKEARNELALFNSSYDKEKKQWRKVKISLGEFLEFASLVQSPNFYLKDKSIDSVKELKVFGQYESGAGIDSQSGLVDAVFRDAAIIVNVSDVLYEEMAWLLRKQRIRCGENSSWIQDRALSERTNLRKAIYMKLADIACEPISEKRVKRYCGYSITSFDRSHSCICSDVVLRKMTELLHHDSSANDDNLFAVFLPRIEKTLQKMLRILNERNTDARETSLQDLSRHLDCVREQNCDEIDEDSVVFFRKMDYAIHEVANCSEDEKESNYVKLVRIYLAIELILDAEKRITVNKLERIIKHLLG